MCNNAAISIPGGVMDVSVKDFDRTIAAAFMTGSAFVIDGAMTAR
jgi:hypothetical protein